MSIFIKVWAWLKKEFVSIEHSAAHIAVAVTEAAKEALQNGSMDVLAKVVDLITKSNIGDEAEAALKLALPKILAVSVAIETHPTSDSAENDVLEWEKKLMDAFNIHWNKSIVFSLIAAQSFGVINSTLKNPGKPTLAAWISAVETIYGKYQADIAANP
jgi:hypothetical protein